MIFFFNKFFAISFFSSCNWYHWHLTGLLNPRPPPLHQRSVWLSMNSFLRYGHPLCGAEHDNFNLLNSFWNNTQESGECWLQPSSGIIFWWGIIKQWLVLWEKKKKNFRLNDCPHHLFPLTVLFYFTCPDYFVCLSVFESCHPFKHHQYWSCHCVCLRALILFITEIISLPLPSLQFQIIKNRTSSSGEKRPDLDLGFWVAMNQGNLWVSCLPALSCPS